MYIKDINLIRAFAVVAQCGSFSAAARHINSTQPTLTRQIQNLEQQTGLNLFERSNKGLRITEAGVRLLDSSKALMESVNRFNRTIAGQEDKLEGEIRISANEIVGGILLPSALAALRTTFPHIQIELDINNSVASLSKRDADIAFRMVQPTQPDLVSRRLPTLPLGLYGTQTLIDQYGTPRSLNQLLQLPFIGFDKETWLIDGLAKIGVKVGANDFSIRTDSLITQLTLTQAGAGYCILQRALAEKNPALVRVLPDLPLPDLAFWLVCHTDIQYSKKISAVMRFLGDWFVEDPYKNSLPLFL